MRRFWKYFLVVFTILFLQINMVSAASKCDYNEQVKLNDAVANIKVSYEEAEGKIPTENMLPNDIGIVEEGTYYYFKIVVYNLTEDIYLKVTNDYDSEVKYLKYENSESGSISFDWENINNITNFTITAYSSSSTGCPNEEYRVIYFSTPRYNEFSSSAKCIGNESFYLCQKYITEEKEVDYESFIKELNSFKNKEIDEDGDIIEDKDESLASKISLFIKDNALILGIISTIIVVGGGVAIVIVIKKRRSRLI